MKYFISESFGVDLGKYREFICKDPDQHERKMFPIILDDIMFYCEDQHKETHKKIWFQ